MSGNFDIKNGASDHSITETKTLPENPNQHRLSSPKAPRVVAIKNTINGIFNNFEAGITQAGKTLSDLINQLAKNTKSLISKKVKIVDDNNDQENISSDTANNYKAEPSNNTTISLSETITPAALETNSLLNTQQKELEKQKEQKIVASLQDQLTNIKNQLAANQATTDIENEQNELIKDLQSSLEALDHLDDCVVIGNDTLLYQSEEVLTGNFEVRQEALAARGVQIEGDIANHIKNFYALKQLVLETKKLEKSVQDNFILGLKSKADDWQLFNLVISTKKDFKAEIQALQNKISESSLTDTDKDKLLSFINNKIIRTLE